MQQKYRHLLFGGIVAILAAGSATDVRAAVSAEEAAKLGLEGTPLTPLGGERAGNADGSIPPWTGGITQPPAGYKPGGWYVDPFAGEQPLFTVTKENYKQYEDMLSKSQVYLLETYSDYFINVYTTHRTASAPLRIYEATMKNATQARRCPDRDRCLENTADGGGFPFPIPTGVDAGVEMVWNIFLRYGVEAQSGPLTNIYVVNKGGSSTLTKMRMISVSPYFVEEKYRPKGATIFKPSDRGLLSQCLVLETMAPPRVSGSVLAGCSSLKDSTLQLYLYLPGQRRVRKAPELGLYDAPGGNTDGLRTIDQFDGYFPSGPEERYDIKVLGKREMLIPYNTYALADPNLKAKELFQDGHINQKYVRYEKHRVWVLDMTLKPGYRHLSPHRIVYVDEDYWSVPLTDLYDNRGRLWRSGETFPINWYDIPVQKNWGTIFQEFTSGRYVTDNGWWNLSEGPQMPRQFTQEQLQKSGIDWEEMTPAGLRQAGRK